MVTIEKGIPIPKKLSRKCKYPWHEMEVGDSFVVELASSNRIGYFTFFGNKITGRKFTSRKIADGLYRIWRVE